MTTYSFYLHTGTTATGVNPLPSDLQMELWRPSLTELVPAGMPGARNAMVWALFHYGHLFANRDYSILLIRRGTQVVHRSFVFPGWFRFPFMRRDDLQVGDTWTDPAERGRGLAALGLATIVHTFAPVRRIWYVVDASHVSSVRVVEKCGFLVQGTGRRRARWGVRALGAFVLDDPPELSAD